MSDFVSGAQQLLAVEQPEQSDDEVKKEEEECISECSFSDVPTESSSSINSSTPGSDEDAAEYSSCSPTPAPSSRPRAPSPPLVAPAEACFTTPAFPPLDFTADFYAPRVCHPNARTYVRLLGPCFKTGRLRPFRQDPEHACTGAKSAPRQPASTASSTEGSKDTDNTTACTKARAMKPRSQAGWRKGLRHLTHSERSQATEPKPVYRAIRTDPDNTTPTR